MPRTPSAAQMKPEHFGPNQISSFLTRILADILPSYFYGPRPIIKTWEDGTVAVEVAAPEMKMTLFKATTGGRWHFIQARGEDVLACEIGCPFDMMKEVVKVFACLSVNDWSAANYDITSS